MKLPDMNTLALTQEWDKTFPKSEKVAHSKITFHNRYGITLVADLYKPLDANGQLAAIAVCGPYGAVKEQVSGRYTWRKGTFPLFQRGCVQKVKG